MNAIGAQVANSAISATMLSRVHPMGNVNAGKYQDQGTQENELLDL